MVAVAEGDRSGEVRLYGSISSDLGALEKVLRKLGGEEVILHVVYEAGPTGYVIYRRLVQLAMDCIVVVWRRPRRPNRRAAGRKTTGATRCSSRGCTGPAN